VVHQLHGRNGRLRPQNPQPALRTVGRTTWGGVTGDAGAYMMRFARLPEVSVDAAWRSLPS
jgi:hypothetical protein